MGLLDICDSTDDGNMWFVVVVIGVGGLNLLLTIIVIVMLMLRKGGMPAHQASVEAGAVGPAVIQTSAAPAVMDSSKAGGYKEELLSVQRALTAMERKIDNKRINEVTSSYLLHNAHDAIGNGVPTASQVTLEQIAAHQAHSKQTMQDMYARLQAIEGMISKLTAKDR
eukprot:CAMPEP_0196731770 /NCGR_PEP_ID=MMETSP1091-20130531/11358_1 /TAXON_ID=302021 /ORGANISM="Rhodomonas sp., Strain CCMP768" /LENGTH=167 /DNA_ID=CAMNT_0042074929 /DNA_START=35 /DNA_END=538 /DNA_ORIENTATION=+